jgi:hypothetical protein
LAKVRKFIDLLAGELREHRLLAQPAFLPAK